MGGLSQPRPLAEQDDRGSFGCGRPTLDQWFTRHAWRNQAAGVSRTNVICDLATGQVAGFVALSAGQIERGFLAKTHQRNRPDPVPIVLLGQLAVDGRYQKRGCARSLVQFALNTARRFSREIGCYGVVTHPLDDALYDFYRQFGFELLPHDPRQAMIVRISDLENACNPLTASH